MSHINVARESGAPPAELSLVNIDTANPAASAQFYATALGWEVTYSDDNYGMVQGNGTTIGFGRIEGFQPPSWPDEQDRKSVV